VHANFLREDELPAFGGDWLARVDVQFHWRNDAGWRGFDDFLGALNSRKRKNIRAEREQVRRAGVTLRQVHGDEASEAELAVGIALQVGRRGGDQLAVIEGQYVARLPAPGWLEASMRFQARQKGVGDEGVAAVVEGVPVGRCDAFQGVQQP
jgi:hypothetical protein